MHPAWFFGFFAISGFCSLIYEVVWLRLAMAGFGVTTPLVSLVLSLFMAGLGIGSLLGGRLSVRRQDLSSGEEAGTDLRRYAAAEGLIALSSILVPLGFSAGRHLLGWLETSWGSSTHYLLSGLVIALSMLPFGVCMGATFPLAMAAMRRLYGAAAQRSFSYLYLANLIGATLGTLGSAFVLIELLGFSGTLRVAGALNLLLCAVAFGKSFNLPDATADESVEQAAEKSVAASGDSVAKQPDADRRFAPIGLLWLLLTGLCSMAMEVVWTRLYTPFLGTLVYAFAAILATYLAATFIGSQLYRLWARLRGHSKGLLWLFVVALLGIASLLPLLASDPLYRRPGFWWGLKMVALGVAPFCAALGFLTPLLVDRYSRGSAQRAGLAYAVNVLGCILGPLLAGFLLLPHVSERTAMLLLAVPLFLFAIYTIFNDAKPDDEQVGQQVAVALCLFTLPFAGWLFFGTHSFFDAVPLPKLERRDYAATTIAHGVDYQKHLFVNGVGMTTLTPITKMMVHLPLALHRAPPQRVLVICFGMGTSYRSALSWGVQATAVELVPSIPSLIGFFHADGDVVLRAPNGRIVIDDGRRFLNRETTTYDLIVIDPPPPVEAAGSSLLYTTEMYDAVRRRLAPGGLVQQWLPVADLGTMSAVARAIKQSFPHVEVFASIERWGFHFLASADPIELLPAAELAARLPNLAKRDITEWGPFGSSEQMLARVLSYRVPIEEIIKLADVPTMEDNRPVNEYFLLRRGSF